MIRIAVCLLAMVMLISPLGAAQDDGIRTTIFERVIVREGPGDTYAQVAMLGAGVDIRILERNYPGHWLHIVRTATPGGNDIQGWVKTGFVDLPDDLSFDDVTLNPDVTDADTSSFIDEDIIRLYDTPLVPTISEAMIDVFAVGQERGMNADVITKIGDSNSASGNYLPPVEANDYDLGPYTFLQDTIDYYGDSFQQGSISARVGMNAFSIFDPLWADKEQCEANEGPISCEYRVTRPAIALIMFGPNDLKALNTDQYREQLTAIVEYSTANGIIPVLSTFSSNPNLDNWFQAVRFNVIVLDVAKAHDVPVINLWSAARSLPNYGLGMDNVHLTTPGVSFRLGHHESRFGIPLQNLIVLTTLHELRLALDDSD